MQRISLVLPCRSGGPIDPDCSVIEQAAAGRPGCHPAPSCRLVGWSSRPTRAAQGSPPPGRIAVTYSRLRSQLPTVPRPAPARRTSSNRTRERSSALARPAGQPIEILIEPDDQNPGEVIEHTCGHRGHAGVLIFAHSRHCKPGPPVREPLSFPNQSQAKSCPTFWD